MADADPLLNVKRVEEIITRATAAAASAPDGRAPNSRRYARNFEALKAGLRTETGSCDGAQAKVGLESAKFVAGSPVINTANSARAQIDAAAKEVNVTLACESPSLRPMPMPHT